MLHHPALISSDYPIASDNECIDQYSSHAGPSAYPHATHDPAAVEQFRRDGTLPQPAPSPFPYSATHGARMFSENNIASDATTRYVSHSSMARPLPSRTPHCNAIYPSLFVGPSEAEGHPDHHLLHARQRRHCCSLSAEACLSVWPSPAPGQQPTYHEGPPLRCHHARARPWMADASGTLK